MVCAKPKQSEMVIRFNLSEFKCYCLCEGTLKICQSALVEACRAVEAGLGSFQQVLCFSSMLLHSVVLCKCVATMTT